MSRGKWNQQDWLTKHGKKLAKVNIPPDQAQEWTLNSEKEHIASMQDHLPRDTNIADWGTEMKKKEPVAPSEARKGHFASLVEENRALKWQRDWFHGMTDALCDEQTNLLKYISKLEKQVPDKNNAWPEELALDQHKAEQVNARYHRGLRGIKASSESSVKKMKEAASMLQEAIEFATEAVANSEDGLSSTVEQITQ